MLFLSCFAMLHIDAMQNIPTSRRETMALVIGLIAKLQQNEFYLRPILKDGTRRTKQIVAALDKFIAMTPEQREEFIARFVAE